jgi:hypothetical protein
MDEWFTVMASVNALAHGMYRGMVSVSGPVYSQYAPVQIHCDIERVDADEALSDAEALAEKCRQ